MQRETKRKKENERKRKKDRNIGSLAKLMHCGIIGRKTK